MPDGLQQDEGVSTLLDASLRRTVLLQGGDGMPVPLGSLLDRRAVVLLGDPGLGKSTCMEAVARAAGAPLRTVRGFLAARAGDVGAPGTTLLDGLDETMALSADRTVVDEVVARLSAAGWPAFWLSCRPADWARADGRALLAECAPGGIAVAHLLPLSDDEIEAAVAGAGLDPPAVLRAMEAVGLLPLLGNPQTLRLVTEVFADGGSPTSRTDLYRRATEHLARESNRLHASAAARPSDAELLEAGGAAAAVLLLSGRVALAPRGAEIEGAVPIGTMDRLAPAAHLEAALQSRLFAATPGGGWVPAHRTVAEFLAAAWMARRVELGSEPLGRTLALICGGAGAPDPSLGGLFAWLAALLPDDAERFVGRDPYTVVAYGDVAALRPGARHALLAGLRDLSESEPFFRAGRWGEARLGALAVPELADGLRQIIATRPVRFHLLSCALEAVEHGAPLPDLTEDLAALIFDASLDTEVRTLAISTFANVAPAERLRTAFFALLADNTVDPGANLAGTMLLKLYPTVLGEDEVEAFLLRFVATDTGQGDRLHVEHRLPKRVPAVHAAGLLDRLARHAWPADAPHPLSRAHEVRELARRLAARAIPTAPPTRAVSWLALLAGDGTGGANHRELREAFASRPDLYVPLLAAVASLSVRDGAPLPPSMAPWRARQMLPWCEPPPDAAARLVAAVEADPDAEEALALYASALVLLLHDGGIGCEDIFERCHAAAGLRLEFEREREKFAVCPLGEQEEWRREERRRREEQARNDVETRQRSDGWLAERAASIADGSEEHGLEWLAQGWFGRIHAPGDAEPPRDPVDRLARLVQPEVTRAAMSGFRAYAERGPLPTPGELAARAGGVSIPAVGLAALAGADLLAVERGDAALAGLPPERRVALLCLGLVHATQTTVDRTVHRDRRPWMGAVADALPDESAAAVRALLLPQLAAGAAFLDGWDQLQGDPALRRLLRDVLPDLLAAVPAAGSALDPIWRTALVECPLPVLGSLVGARLARASSPADRWPWLVFCWRIAPADHEAELLAAARADDERLHALMQDVGENFDPGGPPLTARHREVLIRLTGPRFPPAPAPPGSWSRPTPYDRACFVHRHIAALGDTGGAEAGAGLNRLLSDPSLAAHADHLRNAIAAWRRRARLAARAAPSISDLVRALSGGPPATKAELHAFVVAHLQDLRREVRSAAEDAWRAFWNVDAKRGPTEGRPEEDCRDAIVRLLAARLERAGLAQETEARRVARTRCDIVVGHIAARVPVEVKCDWNGELWTAWREQLDNQYCTHPEAGGFGVYLVVWFGARRGRSRRVPAPSAGAAPASAEECQRMLDAAIEEDAGRLVTVVLDVSPISSVGLRAGGGPVRGGSKTSPPPRARKLKTSGAKSAGKT